ncbi:YicC/YloC family endoribonuclease [Zongyangia hominis]|uniref:YicC family protein n=1 Tax=Zongyangia hominis TaxID=2763677 RepID=A0A926EBN2_9FIRM|nr:YicC/YloC family endoribonuclease [Zongyangia hominis]MBC8570922.1 YicC family protein [Zongyangia hominis]
MIRSMTGYGRSEQIIDGRDILFEIKSVNHRFFEFSARVPRVYGYLEEKIKSYLQQRVSRGKIDVGVTILTLEGASAEVEINHDLTRSYVKALRELSEKFDLTDDLSLSSISRFSDIFTVRKNVEDESVIWDGVRQVADEAVAAFLSMRETEGGRLAEDIRSRLDFIEEQVARVEERSPATVKEYYDRLYQKMTEVLGDNRFDEQRIITEAAIFADKVAVNEETVRLHSHLGQFREILSAGGPVGRKLDFLVQEVNREVNTIGSKAQDSEIARIVVDVKSEIEKIREQIQNLE